MANIIYRQATQVAPGSTSTKNAPLTNAEVDGNIKSLNDDIASKAPIASPTFTGTVGGITKSMVGLGNVDNTSDATKPVSSAQASAIATKQDTLVSGTNIKTVNSTSLVGSGDVAVQPTLVSGTNIKTVNGGSLLGSGDIVLPTATSTTTFSNKTITGLKETRVSMPANDIDLSAGNVFTKTITALTTFTVSNVAASGSSSSFILDLTNGGAFVITWWAGMKWANGAAPTLTVTGRDVLGFFTHDGGTTWNGYMIAKGMA